MSDAFWENAARRDPLWAILSDPSRRGRRWTLPGFFETGRREISLLLYELGRLGHPPLGRRALDFGCGVGRLSQALGAVFREVVGVDISPTMIRLADRLNRAPQVVRYMRGGDDLRQFDTGSFDFIYSDIVLQHLPPEQSERYLREFLRVLTPGGVLVFQLPSHRRTSLAEVHKPIAMPDAAYRASLELVEPVPPVMPGAPLHALLRVTNRSLVNWDQERVGSIRAGNHWFAGDTAMLIQDDGRASLPSSIAPNQSVFIDLEVTAPPHAGRFVCEFDVVHEGITWFGDRGSQTLRVDVVVGAGEPPTDRGGRFEPPHTDVATDYPDIDGDLEPEVDFGDVFPMYGIAAERVAALVDDCGGVLFHREPDERGGPEWVGFRYFVLKPAPSDVSRSFATPTT